jgi:NitT/TauT family transport system substrate-binding protein
MMKKSLYLALLVTAILLLAACNTTTTPIEQNPPLKIGWSLWPGYYPLILADKLGYFKDRGLNVDARFYENSADIPIDFTAGRLDTALVTVFDALPINARSASEVSPIVMITDNTTTGDAIVATSAISTVADLKGKRIAVAFDSYAEVLIKAMLEQAGLSANDVTLVDIPPEQVPEQLGRTIDAGHTFDPFITQAIDQGNHVIFTGVQTPGLLLDVLIARQAVVKERPQDVRAFIDAFFAAQEWWRQHQIEGNHIIAEATGQKPEDISLEGLRLYDRADNLKAFIEASAPNSLYRSLDGNLTYLLDSGTLNSRPQLSQLMDWTFLNKEELP